MLEKENVDSKMRDENGNEVEMNGSVENLFDNVADTLLQLDNGNSLSLVLQVNKHN